MAQLSEHLMKAGTRLGHLALLMLTSCRTCQADLLAWCLPYTSHQLHLRGCTAPPCNSQNHAVAQACCEASSCHRASMLSPAWGTRTLETFPSIPKLPEQVLVPSAGMEGSHWNGSGCLGHGAALVLLSKPGVGRTTTDT